MNTKKIGTITFHSSYNYGSNLQAYALQRFVEKICKNNCKYEIINLRTNIQKNMYKLCFEKTNLKYIIKSIIFYFQKADLIEKNRKFEEFIQNELNITKEYNTLDELKKAYFDYDYCISGSDQLWNLNALDFDWANFLEFTNKGEKVSYAASFGPKSQSWTKDEQLRIKKDLLKYKCISVRDEASYDNVFKLTGLKPEINVDPTMLLTIDDWNKLIDSERKISKKYIVLYDLKGELETFKIAKKIGKLLKMPVYIIKDNIKAQMFLSLKKYYNCGPKDFLNLIKNAEMVLSTSFHGTVFSVIFHKPFLVINGANDFRINTLLKKMALEDRTVEKDNIKEKCQEVYKIDFKKSDALLKKEQEKAKDYLIKALEIDR